MFLFHETFEELPETTVQIERVIATDRVLNSYFWVSNVSLDDFEVAAESDSSIEQLRCVDEFDDTALYHGEWAEELIATTTSAVDIVSVILDAIGTQGCWEIEMRFDDLETLSEFQTFCVDNEIDMTVRRLFELSRPLTGSQYGLTEKQQDALVTAWEAGYYETPRKATLSEIAEELHITQQSLSNRLRRGHQMLIGNTLTLQPADADRHSHAGL